MDDAGAVFLATFGALVFGQLALDVADQQLQMSSTAGAAVTVAVALAGAVAAAVIWWVDRAARAGRLRQRRHIGQQALPTSTQDAGPSSDATPMPVSAEEREQSNG